MVIEGNKENSRKSIASISKKSATLGAIVLGSAFAVSSFSAHIDMPTVEASEGTAVTFASTNNAFLDSIIPDAYQLANENDLYASVMIAQAILESNWGASGLASAPHYNLFGIKGTYNGQGATFYTLEDDGSGNYYQIRDSFRSYPSYKESLTDYANKMRNGVSWDSNFYAGTWKSNTNSYTDATAALTGTYATDTRYGGKLNNLITTHGLSQYDTPAGSTSSSSAVVASPVNNLASQGTTSAAQGGKSYTVKAGDGLYSVARALGVSVSEVKAQNGLTSNLIHPGQVLSVASSSASADSNASNDNNNTNTDASASTGKSYTVQAGDGLYSVARALGVSVSEARALNGGSDLIHPGQVITANGSASEEVSEDTTNNDSSASTSGKSYTVQAGDGLYTVARALGVSVSEARALNGGSDLIHPGQVITANGSAGEEISEDTTNNDSSASTSGKSYTVQAGDGLYTVARALGISVSEARALNGGSDLIHPGQVITANGSASEEISEDTTNNDSSASTSGKSYTVQAGDGLYTVARALGVSVSEARALNGGSDLIHPGQVITANGSTSEKAEETTNNNASASTGKTYTVKAGDGLYSVARALGVSVSEARALNGGSDIIHPGQVISAGNASASASNSSSSSANANTGSSASTGKTYTVKAGDGLYSVARALGVSVSEARALNGGSDIIHPGQVISAGNATASTSGSSSSSANTNAGGSSASTSGNSYTVKSGDGIYTVARALGISLSEARALNGGSDLIHPGKVFTAGSASQTTSNTSASTSQASESAATSTSSAATASGNSYTVKAGDGIYTVARALGISLSEARALNGGSDTIHTGKVFTTGGSNQASSSASTSSSSQNTSSATTSASTATSGKTHTVKSGETLYRIAKNNGLSLDELMALNGLSNYNLYIGQVLKVK